MVRLFDTHAHLLDEHFDPDREELIRSLPERGVVGFVEACCRETDLPGMENLLKACPYAWGSAGIHPEYAEEFTDATIDHLREALKGERMVAVGEIGLDYHYEDGAPRDVQKRAFAEQVRLAKELGLPVIIHDRDAHGDMLDILRAERQGLSGIMHCFSGSYEMAKDCMDYGLFIAFGGAVTFKNARKQREIASKIPLDRLLMETDCPYMTPEPFRGKRNDPGLISNTLRVLSEIRGMEEEALSQILLQNALRVFQLTDRFCP